MWNLWNPPQTPPTSFELDGLDCCETASNRHSSTSLFPSTDSNSSFSQAFNDRVDQFSQSTGCNSLPDAGKGSSSAAREAIDRFKDHHYQTAHLTQMQNYLASGDPILIAEALTCLKTALPGFTPPSTPTLSPILTAMPSPVPMPYYDPVTAPMPEPGSPSAPIPRSSEVLISSE
ncbi:MAG: hypothetical protein HC769_03965 [Cyanobacteria bacterium CRU_2_1]|nr:hypothetical protein [Cyanobacteria bacterium CRU_2_1]